jgi:uncharacterized damage-inducible protein DinB
MSVLRRRPQPSCTAAVSFLGGRPAERNPTTTFVTSPTCCADYTERGPVTVERIEPPLTGSERETLRAYLDWHRATLALKCEQLSHEQLRQRSMPPSTLSLLGLVRHMAEVERSWFRRVVNGEDVPLIWSADRDFQVAYDATDADPAEAFAAWEAEMAHARRIELAAPSLDVTGVDRGDGTVYSLRLVLLHVTQEYARHNGHADLIREGIDGVVGV